MVFASRPPSGIEAETVLADDVGGAGAATAQLSADGHIGWAWYDVPVRTDVCSIDPGDHGS
ncbi:hypothetical protein [Streptomyces sp. NPDC005077]|uniref:hypothetical protein n=1 Tax=Streptomyces sp. NPDC005077 TaxID=3154292 RepID=UPI0033B21F86